MKKLLIVLFLLMAQRIIAQNNSSVYILDFVKIKDDKIQETLYFYENNWKEFRDIALQKGYIKSYQLLKMQANNQADFDLILMTEYADSTQYQLAEERFQEIIREHSNQGIKLLNDLKPADFRQNLFMKTAQVWFESSEVEVKK